MNANPIEAKPDARADLEALAAAVDPAGAPAQLLGGNVAALATRLDDARPAVARVAIGTEVATRQQADALEAADAVWVPTAHSRDALVRAGVTAARVHVVPPVVDVERFSPEAPAQRDRSLRSTVFLALVDFTRASGWDVLLRAWAEEFSADDDVTLVLRAYSSEGLSATLIAESILAELEALGVDPAKMADFVLETSRAQAEPGPEVYLAADCFVAPARADAWGRRLLEAMACGIPVIATDWAAGADLIPSGAGYHVPATPADVDARGARELAELVDGRWAEPDVARLRLLLRAVAADPAFAATIGERGREAVLARHAPLRPLTAPTAAAPPRRAVRADRPGARPQDVSFVIQGPIERAGDVSTARACASIRAHFPGAEIVISTWEGSDVEGLDCDRAVLSRDPGPVPTFGYNLSTNRLIDSSLAGVRAATRPLVVKLRSDVQFRSDALLSYWGRWKERTDRLRLFQQRVLVPNVFTRRPSNLSPRILHPSDWAVFGTREDLELLFDVPHMGPDDAGVRVQATLPTRMYHPGSPIPRATPEQWIWMGALRKADPDVSFVHHLDLTPETLVYTELGFANNLAVLDAYTQFGIWCPKYPFPNRLFEDPTLVQHHDWLELYEIHCRGAKLQRGEVMGLLKRIAAGELDGLTHADASRLRRAGLTWEAQQVDCIAIGRLRRDSTTGGESGAHVWHLDQTVMRLVREELMTLARQRVEQARGGGRRVPAGVR